MKTIIRKFIANTITEAELDLLNTWLENPDNHSEFERYIQDYHDLNLAMLKNNVDEAYENVKKSIHVDKKAFRIIHLFQRNYIKYAAVILILISSGVFFLTKNNSGEHNSVSINPGTDKAILTLANGTELALDSVTNYNDNLITNTGKDVIYKEANSEINTLEYNYLTIPRGGQYHVVLSDGTEVWVNSESQLKYPVNFIEGKPRTVELVYGEAYFEVSPSTAHKGAKFFVLNENQTVEVLGTKFNIKAYKGETQIYTTLVEGKVSINTTFEKQSIVPNEQSVYSLDLGRLSIHQVKVNREIAWINGEFIFHKKTLKDIAKVLTRWYNVEIVFFNDAIAEQKFNGELKKDQKLETILKLIKDTNKIQSYEMKDGFVLLK